MVAPANYLKDALRIPLRIHATRILRSILSSMVLSSVTASGNASMV